MDYAALGRLIRHHRTEMHLTQEELAEQAGVSTSFLGHIERGSRIMSLDTFVRLCRTLHLTPNEMLAAEVDLTGMPETITISPARLINNIVGLMLQSATDDKA